MIIRFLIDSLVSVSKNYVWVDHMETDPKRDSTSAQYVWPCKLKLEEKKVKTCQCDSGSFGSTVC
jgi:hypothetical protein